MIIKDAEYKASYVDVAKCPDVQMPEFAFIGRSNVGKSSLINYLTQRRALSKVSNTPGKTKTLNFFELNQHFQFVDLPGYSFAKVSKQQRDKWNNMIRNYILKREQLQYVCLLIDARISPQRIDLDFCRWMAKSRVPFVIIFTKADKPSAVEIAANIQQFKNVLLEEWEELPPSFTTSSEKKLGSDKVWEFLSQAVKDYYKMKENSKAF